jgi:predicted nucleotide-binding protein
MSLIGMGALDGRRAQGVAATFSGSRDQLADKLALAGLTPRWEEKQNGVWQAVFPEGDVLNWSSTKKTMWVQGKPQQKETREKQIASILGSSTNDWSSKSGDLQQECSRNVFVVYGHDVHARNGLEAMLRRWGLEPIILDQLTADGQTIIEKLETARGQASFAIVLATPDDQGYKRDRPTEIAYRARQNVVLELGMMLAILGRARVAILTKSDVHMERPSDIQGLIYKPFKDDLKEIALSLAKEIDAQGIRIDLRKV